MLVKTYFKNAEWTQLGGRDDKREGENSKKKWRVTALFPLIKFPIGKQKTEVLIT